MRITGHSDATFNQVLSTRHSGLDPESRGLRQQWIPACAGMTVMLALSGWIPAPVQAEGRPCAGVTLLLTPYALTLSRITVDLKLRVTIIIGNINTLSDSGLKENATMRTRPLAFVACLGVLLAGLAASPPAEGADPATVQQVVAHYADLVRAGYQDSYNQAVALQSALQVLTERPSAAALEAAKNAWKRARIPYGQTEAFRFYGGPIDAADGPEGQLNAWPLDESYIDYVQGNPCAGVINDPHAPITRENLLALNEQGGEENVSLGYHAIEFLLWGQDLSADGPGARPVSDYVEAPRRAQYLHTVAAQLVSDLQSLVQAWAPGQNDNYRTAFLAQAPKEALRQILVGIGTLGRSELAGERMAVALESRDQEDEHSCFSDNTHVDIIRNAQGIQNVLEGRYARSNGRVIAGPGILVLLQDGRRAELQQKTRNAMTAVHTIQPPFDREIGSPIGRQRVQAAIHALRAQAEVIVNAAADLGIANLQVELPE